MWNKVQKPRSPQSIVFDIGTVGTGPISQQIATEEGEVYEIAWDYTAVSGTFQLLAITHGPTLSEQRVITTPGSGSGSTTFEAIADNELICFFGGGEPLPDTSWAGEITNISVMLDGGGPELVTNGAFTGSLAGWNSTTEWSYGSNSALFTASSPGKIVTIGGIPGSGNGTYQLGDILTFSRDGNGQGQVIVTQLDLNNFPTNVEVYNQGNGYEVASYPAFINQNVGVWTDIPKPSESSVMTMSADAQPWGLLLAITSVVGGNATSVTSGWGMVPAPMFDDWIRVDKPNV